MPTTSIGFASTKWIELVFHSDPNAASVESVVAVTFDVALICFIQVCLEWRR